MRALKEYVLVQVWLMIVLSVVVMISIDLFLQFFLYTITSYGGIYILRSGSIEAGFITNPEKKEAVRRVQVYVMQKIEEWNYFSILSRVSLFLSLGLTLYLKFYTIVSIVKESLPALAAIVLLTFISWHIIQVLAKRIYQKPSTSFLQGVKFCLKKKSIQG